MDEDLILDNRRFRERNYEEIFPYGEYRREQKKIIEDIRETLKNEDVCIVNAINGTGKTILSLVAAFSLESNGVIILGRTHRQMEHFVREIDTIRNNTDFDTDYVELLSRSSYCINIDINKIDPSHIDIACRKMIRFGKGTGCSYKSIDGNRYRITIENPSTVMIRHAKYQTLKQYGIRHKVCPYYLSRGMAQNASVVIGTFMHVDKDVRRAIGLGIEGKIIIFDEAHNLPSFLEEKQKREIDIESIDRLMEKRNMPDSIRNFLKKVKRFIQILSERIEIGSHSKIPFDGFADAMEESGITYRWLALSENILRGMPRTPQNYEIIYEVGKVLSLFEMYLEIDENAFIGYVSKVDRNIKVGIQSLDISHEIRELVNGGAKILFMSGTLDAEMFSFRLGLDKLRTRIFEYGFDKRDLMLYVISKGPNGVSLSTKYHSRNDKVYSEYAKSLKILLDPIPNGALIFFPSYKYKEDIFEYLDDEDVIEREGDDLYMRTISGERIKIFNDVPDKEYDAIEEFKKYISNGVNRAALLSVYRSRASEGEDYRYVRGIFIIGIPLANINDAGVSLKMNYYNSIKGGSGNRWYTSDAMDAVNQACGRGIRKTGDYCAIFLMDERYLTGKFFNKLSKWIRDGLVRSIPVQKQRPNTILPHLKRFYDTYS